jgi:hypothetical protein
MPRSYWGCESLAKEHLADGGLFDPTYTKK